MRRPWPPGGSRAKNKQTKLSVITSRALQLDKKCKDSSIMFIQSSLQSLAVTISSVRFQNTSLHFAHTLQLYSYIPYIYDENKHTGLHVIKLLVFLMHENCSLCAVNKVWFTVERAMKSQEVREV